MPGQRDFFDQQTESAPIDELVWMWGQLSAHQQFAALWRLRLRVWPRRAWCFVQYWWLEICLRLIPTPRRVWRFVPVSPLIIGDGTIGLA
jgi:hypothetical protein